jgi:hypothetical protein
VVKATKNSENLQVVVASTSLSYWVKNGIATAKKVDVSNCSALKAKVPTCSLNSQHGAFHIALLSSLSDTTNDNMPTYNVRNTHINNNVLSDGVRTMDVSNTTGEYYVVFFGTKGYGSDSGTVNISEIWLE